MNVLVTGANGFVGTALVEACSKCPELVVRPAVRNSNFKFPETLNPIIVDGLGGQADWRKALEGVETVIHTAARVHVMQDNISDPLAEFRQVNVAGSLNLAIQAAKAGVKRFIFLSSIKVNGEKSSANRLFKADDPPCPVDPYGISKMEAEQALRRIAHDTGMEVVIIRPPLVYGPGVKANFLSMMRWLDSGIPLPLGAARNKRSMVALDNLVDLIVTCIHHPAAANQIFMAGDGVALSTTELFTRMAVALDRPARLFPVPLTLLRTGAYVFGKQGIIQRLCGSLQLDITKTCQLLDWTPPVSVDEGLRKTAMWYKKTK